METTARSCRRFSDRTTGDHCTSVDVALGPYACAFEWWRPDQGRIFDGLFSYDTETSRIEEDLPQLVPVLILASACDGRRGVYIARDDLPAFLAAHDGLGFIGHNLAFDLKVTQKVLGTGRDIYGLVDGNLLWDTQVLSRLLSLATAGHATRGESSLDDCVRAHLGLELPKKVQDEQGRDIRTGFGRFLGRPPGEIPAAYLRYAGGDALVTWHLFQELHGLIRGVIRSSSRVWGHVDERWLRAAVRRHGPLTHHIQLRASILMDALNATGIAIDAARREEKLASVQADRARLRERLRRRGLLIGEPGSSRAMQSILREFARRHPEVELQRTPSGEKYSTAEDDLAALATRDEFFADYTNYRTAEKLESTYLAKMARPRIHPRFGYLAHTGRTFCRGGFNLQALPKERGEPESTSIRGALVPGEGHVFIDCDYSQIELVTFAFASEHQFRVTSGLARLINIGENIHKLIAATVLGKDPGQVTKQERASAKPVSFGRPGGMGADTLRAVARTGYGLELTHEEVEQRIRAYHGLCPELERHLLDEVDHKLVLAETLNLTPARYSQATGRYVDPADPEADRPQAWLGAMLLRVLLEPVPVTREKGRPYTAEEIAFFWEQAQRLPIELRPALRARLEGRQADVELWKAVRNWAGRRPVFTVTGRLRANATFSSARNCVFQGPAADGAIYGLWLVWLAGHRIVSFVHDQIVVETPADEGIPRRVTEIKELMRRGMHMVVPGMNVQVESFVTRSLSKGDLDSRYMPDPAAATPVAVSA
jgi:hypothetical protein